MIKKSFGQWKANKNSGSHAIITITIVTCLSILLFKYFILTPIRDYFKNRPPKKKTKIEKQIKKENASPKTVKQGKPKPAATIPIQMNGTSKQDELEKIRKERMLEYEKERLERQKQKAQESALKHEQKLNKYIEKQNDKLEKKKLKELKKQEKANRKNKRKENINEDEIEINDTESDNY